MIQTKSGEYTAVLSRPIKPVTKIIFGHLNRNFSFTYLLSDP